MLTMMAIVGSLCGGFVLFLIILASILASIVETLRDAKDVLLDREWWNQWLPSF